VWSAELRPDGAVSGAVRIAGFTGAAIQLSLSGGDDGTLVAGWGSLARRPRVRGFLAVRRGGDWTAARPLPAPPEAEGFAPASAVGTDGTVAAAWQTLSVRGSEVRLALRESGGRWRRTTAVRGADHDVAVAPDGRALVAWTTDGAGTVMLSRGTASTGWSRPIAVSGGHAGGAPRVAALGDGAVVAWIARGRDRPGSSRLMAAEVAPDGRVERVVTVSDGAGLVTTPALASDAQGRAVLVWSQRTDERRAVLTAAWRRPDGSWTAPGSISDGTGYAVLPSVGLRGDELRVVWTEARDDETSVRAATVRLPG
jgi:hypothetical protein